MTPIGTPTATTPQIEQRRRSRTFLPVVLLAIGIVAFLVRLSILVRGGGLSGLGAYDDGVYYAAADALIHGRLPYRDFLFIQPPLITVVAAPFAAIGTWFSDPFGFKVARIAFIAIGGINAALCGAIVRRFGWPAVVVAGLGYALFHPAVYSERSVLLEPLGTLGILLAILLLQLAPTHQRLAVVAGIVAGLAAGAKIWYVVPAVLLLLLARRVHLRYLIGVAIGGCAIYLPFLIAAPQRMVQEVILDQIGRGGAKGIPTAIERIPQILGAQPTVGIPEHVLTLLLAALALAAIATTLLTRDARTFGVLAVATMTILLVAPSWFAHYTALTAPPLLLCAGVATGRLSVLLQPRPLKVTLASVVVLGILITNAKNDLTPYGVRTPGGLTEAAHIVTGCITADDPGTLIQMNVLSRDLRDPNCAVWPDVTGWTYDTKDLARASDGSLLDRRLNTRWQADVIAFMESGDATIRTRSATGTATRPSTASTPARNSSAAAVSSSTPSRPPTDPSPQSPRRRRTPTTDRSSPHHPTLQLNEGRDRLTAPERRSRANPHHRTDHPQRRPLRRHDTDGPKGSRRLSKSGARRRGRAGRSRASATELDQRRSLSTDCRHRHSPTTDASPPPCMPTRFPHLAPRAPRRPHRSTCSKPAIVEARPPCTSQHSPPCASDQAGIGCPLHAPMTAPHTVKVRASGCSPR